MNRPGVVVVTVTGIGCRHDVRTISARIADLDGVISIQVDRAANTVTVEGDVTAEAVRAAVAAAGYEVS